MADDSEPDPIPMVHVTNAPEPPKYRVRGVGRISLEPKSIPLNIGRPYLDQGRLASPPLAPSEFVFLLPAIAHVGRALEHANWKDWETTAIDDPSSPGVVALHRAFRELRKAILDKEAFPYGMPLSGGEIFPVRASMFSDDSFADQVIRTGIHQTRERSTLLFVSREGLEAAFKYAPKVSAPSHIEPENLSKYLQLALYVHSLGYGPDFRGQKKEVQKALVDAAPKFGLELSSEQENYLATFLRNKDAQAGRNRKNHDA